MSAPTIDLSLQISQLETQISYLTAKVSCIDKMTESESLATGTALVQACQALDTLIGASKKTRKPFRVTSTHPRW